MTPSKLTFIGDVHGRYKSYRSVVEQCDYSVQIGDFSFAYDVFNDISLNHRFFGGNHDNYEIIGECPNNLGDFGTQTINGVEFFFIRGAWSIDRKWRRFKIDWFPEEELNYVQQQEALEAYRAAKPKIMVTHDAPLEVVRTLFGTDTLVFFDHERDTVTATGQLLQECFNYHQPDLWIFGHHHKNRSELVLPPGEIYNPDSKEEGYHDKPKTRFICLGELQTFTVEP